MSHDASWGIVAKLGTRAIQRRRLHAHAMYGCWIMHEITLIGWPVTCGRDYLPITSACGATVPTVIPMLLSNAQILRRGHAAGGWSRSEDTHEECNRARVLSICPLQHVSRPWSFCSMCYEQLSLSYRPTLQSLTSVIVGEMLRRSETYPRRLVSSRVGARSGDENCLRATSWRTRSHCCPCSTSELTANFFWTSAVVAVAMDRLPRSMMLQFSFVFVHVSAYGVRRHYVRRHFVPMVPPAVITIRMRTL